VVGTSDDIRYTYMFGIDMTAQNGQEFEDDAFDFYINASVEEFERYLGIVIKRRRIITQPSDTLVRAKAWTESCDYTHEDDPYPFDASTWRDGYGQLQLQHYPVISIATAKLYTETDAEILDLLDSEWLRLDKKSGLLSFFPKTGVETVGPFIQGGMYLRTLYNRGYPHGFKFDYDAGYSDSDHVPEDLRQNVLKFASIMALASVGDGLLAGFSSSSISLDGLSESFSSTQSATSAYFGARISQYSKEIIEFLKRNRYKYSNMPMAFI